MGELYDTFIYGEGESSMVHGFFPNLQKGAHKNVHELLEEFIRKAIYIRAFTSGV